MVVVFLRTTPVGVMFGARKLDGANGGDAGLSSSPSWRCAHCRHFLFFLQPPKKKPSRKKFFFSTTPPPVWRR